MNCSRPSQQVRGGESSPLDRLRIFPAMRARLTIPVNDTGLTPNNKCVRLRRQAPEPLISTDQLSSDASRSSLRLSHTSLHTLSIKLNYGVSRTRSGTTWHERCIHITAARDAKVAQRQIQRRREKQVPWSKQHLLRMRHLRVTALPCRVRNF